jgi:preprotein translocase subunit SecA
MFEQLMWGIDDEVVHRIYKVQVQQQPTDAQNIQTHTHADGSMHQGAPHAEAPLPTPKPRKMVTNTPTSEVSESAKTPIESKKKLSRNDPCWCGSGKKFKKCHYPNLQS